MFHTFLALSLTCPQSMTVTTESGLAGATVEYSQPTPAGGNSPISAVTCNPMSTYFYVGTHTVACTYEDSTSNTTMCSFEVLVNPRK